MTDSLRLDDQVLHAAGEALVTASYVMVHNNLRAPTEAFDTLSGAGAQVEHYLKGMAVARAALADAAKTAGESIAALMRESEQLDELIASNLSTGYAVRKGSR